MSKKKLGTYKTSVAFAGMCPTKPLISIQSAVATRQVTQGSALGRHVVDAADTWGRTELPAAAAVEASMTRRRPDVKF